MLRTFRLWLIRYCEVCPQDLRYAMYIHPHANVDEAKEFWTRELSIESSSLRTYFKKPNHSPRSRNTGKDYHGTMRIRVARSTMLLWRIEQWIGFVSAHCGVV